MVAGALFSLGLFEVLAGFFNWARQPWLGATAALAAVVYMFWIVYRTRPSMRALRLAIEGERAVGQFLEDLRALGYKVLHDLPGEGFNIDHVVIGPAGLFSIETKTWSIPDKGRPTIDFDGASIRVAGGKPDSRPLDQARAQASWLGELLHQSTGRHYKVQPVVLFPGWYIQKAQRSKRDVWVLNPRAFPKFLLHAPNVLDEEAASMASLHLTRYAQVAGSRAAAE